jgi:hypothetical protein
VLSNKTLLIYQEELQVFAVMVGLVMMAGLTGQIPVHHKDHVNNEDKKHVQVEEVQQVVVEVVLFHNLLNSPPHHRNKPISVVPNRLPPVVM